MSEEYYEYLPYIILLLIVGIGYFGYTYYMKSKNIDDINDNLKNDKKNLSVKINDEFIKADGFVGVKKGYIFKKGDKGLGYYLDK
uniref:Uncharacterized protein n=1 Tax=viral metagenome TaxID=1070528 RepID=A0A6C0C538_9ZZZZ